MGVEARLIGMPAEDDARRWDLRHAEAGEAQPEPPLGLDDIGWMPEPGGRMLDVACGRGAQAVWAASMGLRVVALDISRVAVTATRALATSRGVGHLVDARVHDLDQGLPDELGVFDLVVCQRFRAPTLIPDLLSVLAPHGVASLTVLTSGGLRDPGRHRAPPGETATAVRLAGGVVLSDRRTGRSWTTVASPPERFSASGER